MMTENKKTKAIAELTAGFQTYILLDRKISRRTENEKKLIDNKKVNECK